MSVPAGSSRSNKVPQGSPVEEALDRLEGCITRVKDGTISVGRTSEEDADAALATVRAELERLTEERDDARRVAPAVRQVIEKALRRDMTKPPVTRQELQFALDLLPEPPSFRSSVDGMEALLAARDEVARLSSLLESIREGLREIAAIRYQSGVARGDVAIEKARALLAVSSRPPGDTEGEFRITPGQAKTLDKAAGGGAK